MQALILNILPVHLYSTFYNRYISTPLRVRPFRWIEYSILKGLTEVNPFFHLDFSFAVLDKFINQCYTGVTFFSTWIVLVVVSIESFLCQA